MLLNKNKILLRAIETRDIEDLYQFRFGGDSYEYFYEFPVTSIDGYRSWINSNVSRSDQVNFVIEDKMTKKTIGTISLIDIDNRSKKAEMGRVFLSSDFRGKGYFKDAVEALFDYAFQDLNLRKIYCEVFSDNSWAVKTYIKNGFSEEGLLKKHIYKDGHYKDVIILSIFRNDDRS